MIVEHACVIGGLLDARKRQLVSYVMSLWLQGAKAT